MQKMVPVAYGEPLDNSFLVFFENDDKQHGTATKPTYSAYNLCMNVYTYS
jgi:hypothetical protein